MKIAALLRSLSEKKYFLPPDIFERHKIISGFIPSGATVLDVGGSMSHLQDFSPNCRLTTADVKPPADLIYKGRKIPSKDQSFDVVTAIDVLEHIDKSVRLQFISELNRVAKNLVIISAPYGTPAHIAYEKEAHRRLPNITYLAEHVAKGLPTPEEISQLSSLYSTKISYAGTLRQTDLLFRLHGFETGVPALDSLLFLGKLLIYFLVNLTVRSDSRPKSDTNRFYLLITC